MESNIVSPLLLGIGALVLFLAWRVYRQMDQIRRQQNDTLRQNEKLAQLYLALSQCNQAIIRSRNEDELFKAICQDAVDYGGMKMVWIGINDESTQELIIRSYYGDGSDYLNGLSISTDPASPSAHGPTGRAFNENTPFWCQDFQHDPLTSQWHERGKKFGWGSSAALPPHRHGKTVGVLTLYAQEAGAFDERTRSLLSEMASDISYALTNFEREQQRQEAQSELETSYSFLKTLIDSAPMRIFWKDKDLNYLGCNTLFAHDANEKSPDDIIGKNDFQLSWKEQAELYRHDDQKVLESGIPKLFFEEPQTTPDGKTIWLRSSKIPLHDHKNEIIGVLGMHEDITEQKEAEEALKESRSHLETIIQIEPECVKILDSRGKLIQINPAGLSMLEADTLEIAQMYSITDFLLPEHRAAFLALHKKVMGGENGSLTFEMIGLKGTHRWLETHATPMYDAEGNITSLLGVTRDVTQRLENENELRKRTQAIEQSPNSIIITDFKANIEYVNTAFIENTGYTREEVLGQNPRFLKSGKTPLHAYDEMWAALVNQQKWQGEFINKRKDGSEYIYSINIAPVIDPNGKTTHYIAIEEDISEKKQTQERIHYLANFDVLTGLPNRVQMNELLNFTLSLAKRNGGKFAIMFLDLDHFKDINDTLGHNIGDILLVDLAKRLTDVLREEDTVSRMGGDEFVILLPKIDAHEITPVAQKLLDVISRPFFIDRHELSVIASIGIAIYPSDGEEIDVLSKNADLAMYRAKQEGRNAYYYFTEEMQIKSQRNLFLGNALHSAMERNELFLVYQPQFSITEQKIIGVEALLRWKHPKLGTISPAEFIPIAEDNGTIQQIGEWVLRNAIQQVHHWTSQGLPSLIVAVNLSAVQFRNPHLPQRVSDILHDVGLSPEFLELELTEGVAMHDPASAIEIMNNLHERGIRMSIDDFGTGYSSLSYLKKFKVYKLKIDQSFVRDISTDPEDRVIVGAVIHMARSLGLQTIAEGVETHNQLDYLKEQGCHEIQGYLFSKPLESDAIEQLLRNPPKHF